MIQILPERAALLDTVTFGQGTHGSPEHGACVMEVRCRV
jgi:hypothetical protein